MPHDVTQADREAAADFAWADGDVGTASLRHKIRTGQRDDHPAVQAYAAHRIAAAAEERARVVAFLGRQAEIAVKQALEEARGSENERDAAVTHLVLRKAAELVERGDHIQEK